MARCWAWEAATFGVLSGEGWAPEPMCWHTQGYIWRVGSRHEASVPRLRQTALKVALSFVSLRVLESLSWIFTVLGQTFSIFISITTNSFGLENSWGWFVQVCFFFSSTPPPNGPRKAMAGAPVPLLYHPCTLAWRTLKFHSSYPSNFSLQHVLLHDYPHNTLLVMNRHFSLTFPFSVLPDHEKTTPFQKSHQQKS